MSDLQKQNGSQSESEISDAPWLKMRLLIDDFRVDYVKAEAGNVAAGKRARKLLQEIRKMCSDLRFRIVEFRK